MSDNSSLIIERRLLHKQTPSKVGDTTTKEDDNATSMGAQTEGIMTRGKAAALAAAATTTTADVGSSLRSGMDKDDTTPVEDANGPATADSENAVIPSVKEQQPIEGGPVVGGAAATLLQQGSSRKDADEAHDTAKALGLDPNLSATLLPASAQPFLSDIPVEKPSASEIRRNLTPREARQLAELQYHEQLRAYQRWVAAVADAMRDRATATAAAMEEGEHHEQGVDEGDN
ncbi:hypothetical protein Pmar_PMAR012843, partial [Perkinsus marinus ATCC 50983]